MKIFIFALIFCLGFVAPTFATTTETSQIHDMQKDATYNRWVAALSSREEITPDLVHDNFATVIETNLSAPDADAIISRLSERELFDIARLHRQASFRDEAFQKSLKNRVGRIQQARLNTAFRHAENATDSSGMVAMTAPTVDMTLTEIYLEFRTAPVGSLSVSGSLYETAAFAGTRMAGSFGTGYAIGSALAPVIQTYSPGTWDVIGGTLHSAVQNVMDAGNYASQGQYLNSLDSLFGGFQYDYGFSLGDWSGDWGFFPAYHDWMFCRAYPHVC